MRTLLFILMFAYSLCANNLFEEGGLGGFQLLNRPAGVSAVGRGYTGVVSQPTFARYYNPALYSKIDGHHLSMEHMRRMTFSDLQSTQLELGFSVRRVFFAFEAANQTIGGIYITDDLPTGIPNTDVASSWQFSEFSLNIGLRTDDNLNWAFTLATAFDRFETEIAHALMFGLGITYDLLDHRLVLGGSALNWGITTPMLGKGKLGEGESLPSTLSLGAGYTHHFGQVRLMGTVDAVYTHRFHDEQYDSVSTSFGQRIAVPLGLEVSPIDWATIRIGKRFNGGSDIVNFGAGFTAQWITADISFVIHNLDGETELEWMTGLTLALGKAKPKSERKIEITEPAIVRPLDSVENIDTIIVGDTVDKVDMSTPVIIDQEVGAVEVSSDTSDELDDALFTDSIKISELVETVEQNDVVESVTDPATLVDDVTVQENERIDQEVVVPSQSESPALEDTQKTTEEVLPVGEEELELELLE